MKQRKGPEAAITPETSYLIQDVEELVNKKIKDLFFREPFIVKVKGYIPQMGVDAKGHTQLPIGIRRIANDIDKAMPGTREFKGLDLDFVFPLSPAVDNPLNVTINWSDNTNCVLALTAIGPVKLMQKGDVPVEASRLGNKEMRAYLETLGLPTSMWRRRVAPLVGDLGVSHKLEMERSVTHVIDGSTTIEVGFSALYTTNDEDEKEVVQDLSLNVNHYADIAQRPTYRNSLRFARNKEENGWQYRGLYSGKLAEGELIDELVQVDSELRVPSDHLLDHALNFLWEFKPTQL